MESTLPGAAHTDAAIADDILNEAATWLMELHEGPFDTAQRVRLAQWRQRSPEHERAWQKATVLLDKFGTLPPSGARALRKVSMPQRRKAIKVIAAALAAGPAAWLAYRLGPWQTQEGRYETAIGKRLDITLDDGTRVSLNTDTQIDVDFSSGERLVRLQRGEIMITTARDAVQPPRPFLVAVDQGRLRALGTRFTVRQFERSSQVSVFEGAVEISTAGVPPARMTVPAGQQSRFTSSDIEAATPCDDSVAAWATGMLIADRMPMTQFIAELGRYRSGTLQVDAGVAALAVSGVFPLADTDFTLSLLEQTMPIQVRYFTRYWVRVLPREK